MYRIWAVARHMIAQCLRQKIALIGIGLVVVILAVLPFTTEGDGLTLTSRLQSFLAYTLGGVSFILSVVTVFLSCIALSDEISTKQIFMVASKPIPRWQLFAGKWLGVSLLNVALLLVTGWAVLLAAWYLSARSTNVPADRETLQFEVLTVRHGLQLKEPDFTAGVEQWIRHQREEGRMEEISPTGEADMRSKRLEELNKSWRSIAPREIKRFEFNLPDLVVDRSKQSWLHLRLKPTHSGGMKDLMFAASMQFGDQDEPKTLTDVIERDFVVERFHTLPVPTYALNDKNVLYVSLGNRDPRYSIVFEGDDSFELLYGLGTFHWNLFRALSIVWCRLAFITVVGLLLSSFLSFPVACMGAFLVLAVASGEGFLSTALDWSSPREAPGAEDPMWIVGPVLRPLAQAFIWLVPDFSKFDPIGNVVSGRVVTLNWVAQSLVVLILIKGLIIGALGCLILTKRELAQETS